MNIKKELYLACNVLVVALCAFLIPGITVTFQLQPGLVSKTSTGTTVTGQLMRQGPDGRGGTTRHLAGRLKRVGIHSLWLQLMPEALAGRRHLSYAVGSIPVGGWSSKQHEQQIGHASTAWLTMTPAFLLCTAADQHGRVSARTQEALDIAQPKM